jgi:hypothetical protein
MRKVTICLASISFVLSLSSCVTGLTMDKIQKIHRGMTLGEFHTQVTISPKQTFPIEYLGTKYDIEVYPMQTGTRTQIGYVWNKYGGYTTTYQVPVYDDYIFLFDEKGLMYWGFMNELQKADDELIQQLAPIIAEESKKQAELAKQQQRVK